MDIDTDTQLPKTNDGRTASNKTEQLPAEEQAQEEDRKMPAVDAKKSASNKAHHKQKLPTLTAAEQQPVPRAASSPHAIPGAAATAPIEIDDDSDSCSDSSQFSSQHHSPQSPKIANSNQHKPQSTQLKSKLMRVTGAMSVGATP